MRKYFCEHCKMKGHTKEGSFKLNGYPEWFKNPPKSKKNNGYVGNVECGKESKEQDDPLDYGGPKESNVVNAVVEQVMKMVSNKQGESSNNGANNYAGPF